MASQSFVNLLPDRKSLLAFAAGWPIAKPTNIALINLSENAMYRVDCADGARYCLRLGQPGYQSDAAIQSELWWMSALAQTRELPITLSTVIAPDKNALFRFMPSAPAWRATLFSYVEGAAVKRPQATVHDFDLLGQTSATIAQVSQRLELPSWFQRPTLTPRSFLSPTYLWGDWRSSPHMTPAVQSDLQVLETLTLAALSDLPPTALIHGDMRAANLLRRSDGGLALLDFDDCGYGWPLLDLAAALSFDETLETTGARADAWRQGYQRIAPINDQQWRALPAFLAMRRLTLIGWLATHPQAPEAVELGAAYVADAIKLRR